MKPIHYLKACFVMNLQVLAFAHGVQLFLLPYRERISVELVNRIVVKRNSGWFFFPYPMLTLCQPDSILVLCQCLCTSSIDETRLVCRRPGLIWARLCAQWFSALFHLQTPKKFWMEVPDPFWFGSVCIHILLIHNSHILQTTWIIVCYLLRCSWATGWKPRLTCRILLKKSDNLV